jgi:hypothetical protein
LAGVFKLSSSSFDNVSVQNSVFFGAGDIVATDLDCGQGERRRAPQRNIRTECLEELQDATSRAGSMTHRSLRLYAQGRHTAVMNNRIGSGVLDSFAHFSRRRGVRDFVQFIRGAGPPPNSEKQPRQPRIAELAEGMAKNAG